MRRAPGRSSRRWRSTPPASYTVSGLPTPKDYELTATKPGFVSRPRTVHVEPGDEISDIVLDLLKGDGAINGTVVDAAGQPIAGAAVAASDGTNATSTVTLSADDAPVPAPAPSSCST